MEKTTRPTAASSGLDSTSSRRSLQEVGLESAVFQLDGSKGKDIDKFSGPFWCPCIRLMMAR
jgi:hypothetical protein